MHVRFCLFSFDWLVNLVYWLQIFFATHTHKWKVIYFVYVLPLRWNLMGLFCPQTGKKSVQRRSKEALQMAWSWRNGKSRSQALVIFCDFFLLSFLVLIVEVVHIFLFKVEILISAVDWDFWTRLQNLPFVRASELWTAFLFPLFGCFSTRYLFLLHYIFFFRSTSNPLPPSALIQWKKKKSLLHPLPPFFPLLWVVVRYKLH